MNVAKALATKLTGLFASMFVVALMLFVQSTALAGDQLDVTSSSEGGEGSYPVAFDVVWQDGTTQPIELTQDGNTLYPDEDHGNLEYVSIYGTNVSQGETAEIPHPTSSDFRIRITVDRYNGRWYVTIEIRFSWLG